MNKKKILAELVGYLVRKEFTVYEVLDAYYEESERHFFEDDLPEVTIPSEEQKKPAETLETLETQTETSETESNTEKATESVTIEPQTKADTDTRVNHTNANSDAIHKDNIEKALKKFITSTTDIKYDESKKDKKPKETKSDLTVLEVCQKMNVTTHELKEMIATGDFPQPDCDKKWSVKLLKKEGII